MITYADTTVCPACRAALPPSPERCPACSVPLRHPITVDLFETLTSADRLVARLRATVPAPAPAPTLETSPGTPSSALPEMPAFPAAAPGPTARPARTGLRAASVPSVLLGLGALCLLVAAVTFLAVAWAWLGVGGRTAVLVALTGLTAGAAVALDRRRLRVGGEALGLVSLGLLALDLVGAESAGWFGSITPTGTTLLVGAAVGAGGLGLGLVSRRLAAPQLVAALGLLVAAVALGDLLDHPLTTSIVVVPVMAVAAWGARHRDWPVLAWALAAATSLEWVGLVLGALARLGDGSILDVASVWGGGGGWALLLASTYLLLPGSLVRRELLLVVGGAGATTLATFALALPVLDEGVTPVAWTALLVAAVGSAASVALPARGRAVALAPAVAAGLPLAVGVVALVAHSAQRVLSTAAAERLPTRTDSVLTSADPVLLVPAVLVLLALLTCLARPLTSCSARTWTAVASVAVGVAAVATLAAYPVPLWTVVVALLALATGPAVVALGRDDRLGAGLAASALGALLGAVAASLLHPTLLAVALSGVVVLAGFCLVRGRFPGAAIAGGGVLPLALAWVLWASGDVLGVDTAWRGPVVLVVVGLLAVARPRVEVEVAATLGALLAASGAVVAAGDPSVSTALHLTLAGALVTTSSLVNDSRRVLAWPGGVLLVLATWVRLADLGVSAPEPYTLPAALVLVAVAVRRLRLHPDAPSATLTPGLTLALVPSLLWVLAGDLVSVRALLLGLACLALVLAGAAVRWSAPIVAGGVVGAVLVLAELTPHALQVPQWVGIGAAGALLTVVGVTWESRLREVRRGLGRLERLR